MSGSTENLTSASGDCVGSAELAKLWPLSTDEESTVGTLANLLHELVRPDADSGAWIQSTVCQVQRLTGSERIFLFDAKGAIGAAASTQSAATEVGAALFSADFDGESIPKAQSKVPFDLLEAAVKSGDAIWALDARRDNLQDLDLDEQYLARTRAFAVVPLTVRDYCYGVAYFDHRFQPIEIARDNVDRFVALLRSLGLAQAFEKLEAENRSLWGDVLQLNQKLKNATTADELCGLRKPRSAPPEDFEYVGDYSMIIGSSAPMREIFQLLDRIRDSNAPVLINGESGTGKELIANAIHANGPHKAKNFVSENCAALTETLLESELFGYVKGAFTGANRDHKGLFELADGGTLFLDEVGDMSPNMQKKLLRAVQEGIIRRVGGKEYIHVEVRIISATNKDLLQEVRKGNFREDLYYRLNVINVKLPPLRDRRDDIPTLIEFFLGQIIEETGVQKTVSPQAMRLLSQYLWPGNIRELQNEVKRLFALSDECIHVDNLSDSVRRGENEITWSALEDELHNLTLKEAVELVERTLIKRALLENDANKSQVAKQLQIPKTSLYNKISKYKLDEEVQELLY